MLMRFLAFVCLLVVSGLAQAIPCVPGAVNSLEGTTCEIGDKTFRFTSSFGEVSQFVFTPDSTNPLSPIFVITPLLGPLTIGPGSIPLEFGLNFDVTTNTGSETLVGLDVIVRGSVSGGSEGGTGTLVFAANESDLILDVLVSACLQSGGADAFGCVMDGNAASAVGTFVDGPVSSQQGLARWGLFADSTGTATFNSATYSFDQVRQVPEPASLALVALALAGLRCGRRKHTANQHGRFQ